MKRVNQFFVDESIGVEEDLLIEQAKEDMKRALLDLEKENAYVMQNENGTFEENMNYIITAIRDEEERKSIQFETLSYDAKEGASSDWDKLLMKYTDFAYYYEAGQLQVPLYGKGGKVDLSFEEAVVIIGSKNLYVYFPHAQNRKIIVPYNQIERILVHGYNHSQIVMHIKDHAKSHDLVFEIGTINDTADHSYKLKYTLLSYLTDAYRCQSFQAW